MAVHLLWYVDSILPQASLGWAGAVCTRLCCFSSRRKGSETFEDDCHFPVTGPTLQQPNFEEDSLWALFRKIPGTLLWATGACMLLLPTSYPTALAWLVLIASTQNAITLFFSLLYTYRGFKRMEQSMSNPVKIPALVEPAAEAKQEGASGSPQQGGAPADAIATPVEDVLQAAQVLHVAAICRCTEPIEVLEETIDYLALHSNRANYIILLCLEAKDKHAAAVGETLVRKYAGVFARVMYAIHPGGIEWEVAGKSANVNWGARACYASIEAEMGPRALDRTVITVADCDAKVSEHYFNELSVRFAAAAREKREVFWAPPMLFDEEAADMAADSVHASTGGGTSEGSPNANSSSSSSLFKTDPLEMLIGRNGRAVVRSLIGGAIPSPVKIADQVWSMFVLQNISGVNWVRLPCSTYSVGMRLIASVGYWDSGVESVPEDYHTALKLYWGTSGRCRCEPIYHPVLYQHIDAGSWTTSIVQRFHQGVRHMWGASDIAYITWLAAKIHTVPWSSKLRIILTVYDVHVHASISAAMSTFGFAFMVALRPGFLSVGDGRWFWHLHESLLAIAFTITFGMGCVYEWYATEMVQACKRSVLPGGAAAQSLTLSPSSITPSSSGQLHAMADGFGPSGRPLSVGGSSGRRSPVSVSNCGASSPVAVDMMQDVTPLIASSPGGGGEAGGKHGSFAESNSQGSYGQFYPSSPMGRERSGSACLPRGIIPVRDRSFLACMATCTATSVQAYMLKLIPWVWTPICCLVYLQGTAGTAQTKLLWANRMRPHVSPKTVPTPSATPRSSSVAQLTGGGSHGSSTPVTTAMRSPSMNAADMKAAGSSWDVARQQQGVATPIAGNPASVGAGGRSIRLQLPNAAYGGPRNSSSGQLATLLGGITPFASSSSSSSSRAGAGGYSGVAEARADTGQQSPGRTGSAWA